MDGGSQLPFACGVAGHGQGVHSWGWAACATTMQLQLEQPCGLSVDVTAPLSWLCVPIVCTWRALLVTHCASYLSARADDVIRVNHSGGCPAL